MYSISVSCRLCRHFLHPGTMYMYMHIFFEYFGADVRLNGFSDTSDIVIKVRKSEGDVVTDIDCNCCSQTQGTIQFRSVK